MQKSYHFRPSSSSTLLPGGNHRKTFFTPPPSYSVESGLFDGEQPSAPLGLLPVRNVSQNPASVQPFPVSFDSESFKPDFDFRRLAWSPTSAAYLGRTEKKVSLSTPVASKRSGVTVNRFRSGEITGGRFCTGAESKIKLCSRSGPVVTESLSQSARTKIRRAIQNSTDDFRCFMTVTFSPDHLHPWHLDENGTLRQDFAKWKFKKFLHSIKVNRDRKATLTGRCSDSIAYVWVAELQKNGNVHYHVLLNHRLPIAWLTRLWGQAKNSIDVRSINNLNHASCYIRKYMEKERSTIQGNRYGITQQLRESMRPETTTLSGQTPTQSVFAVVDLLRDTIEANGGKVLDHGFYFPVPSRSVRYRGKDGSQKKTVSVSRGLGDYFMKELRSISEFLPF